jgi:hypothetical protein
MYQRGLKIYQNGQKIYQHFPFRGGPPKYTKNVSFWFSNMSSGNPVPHPHRRRRRVLVPGRVTGCFIFKIFLNSYAFIPLFLPFSFPTHKQRILSQLHILNSIAMISPKTLYPVGNRIRVCSCSGGCDIHCATPPGPTFLPPLKIGPKVTPAHTPKLPNDTWTWIK